MHNRPVSRAEHRRERHRSPRITRRRRDHRGGDQGHQPRIGAEHHDARRAEDGVREQREHRGVQTRDRREARCDRVADAGGHQHRAEHDACDHVLHQPGAPIVAQHPKAGHPGHEAALGQRRNALAGRRRGRPYLTQRHRRSKAVKRGHSLWEDRSNRRAKPEPARNARGGSVLDATHAWNAAAASWGQDSPLVPFCPPHGPEHDFPANSWAF